MPLPSMGEEEFSRKLTKKTTIYDLLRALRHLTGLEWALRLRLVAVKAFPTLPLLTDFVLRKDTGILHICMPF